MESPNPFAKIVDEENGALAALQINLSKMHDDARIKLYDLLVAWQALVKLAIESNAMFQGNNGISQFGEPCVRSLHAKPELINVYNECITAITAIYNIWETNDKCRIQSTIYNSAVTMHNRIASPCSKVSPDALMHLENENDYAGTVFADTDVNTKMSLSDNILALETIINKKYIRDVCIDNFLQDFKKRCEAYIPSKPIVATPATE